MMARDEKVMIAAETMKQFYNELILAGFNKQEALELTKSVLNKK